MKTGFTCTQENLVYANRIAEVYDNDVILPDGSPGKYFRIRQRARGVVVIPKVGANHFLLLEIYRYGSDALELEFPRGGVDSGEENLAAAARELVEETGIRLPFTFFSSLGFQKPDTGVLDNQAEIFLASVPVNSVKERIVPENNEGIVGLRVLDGDGLRAYIRKGLIRDGFTIGAVGFMAAHGIF